MNSCHVPAHFTSLGLLQGRIRLRRRRHRPDFTSYVSVQMMLSSDRLELWNSGGVPAAFTISKLIRAAASISHNQFIAPECSWRVMLKKREASFSLTALHRRVDYAFLDAYFLEFLGLPTLH
jgi:hypothetical protein